ncbi:MAG: hypothetical protein AB1589_22615 [Cyanobacteriota bacterium]
MDEQRLEVYLNLIQALLNCSDGEESQILNAYQDLVDDGLVQTMKQVAAELAKEGDEHTANWLQNVATQLAAEIDYKLALAVLTREVFPEDWARTHRSLGVVYYDRTFGDPAENLEQALAYHENALQVYTREVFPEEWALTQDNLGNIYGKRMRGKHPENLEQALTCYKNALQIFTRKDFPETWATIQNKLSDTYWQRIWGNRAENLERAIGLHLRRFPRSLG